MEDSYQYSKRDLSRLSFNYHVLLGAEDGMLLIYECIELPFIYPSNLEEFYEIRVAEHWGVVMKKNYSEESAAETKETLATITREVNRQQRDCYRIFSEKISPELNYQDVYLYRNEKPEPSHEEFIHNFFNEEVFPFLSPVMIQAGDTRTLIRDRRLYLVIHMTKRSKRMDEPGSVPEYHYALMRTPCVKVPRSIELPQRDGKHYVIFIDDIIRTNLQGALSGYITDGCYSIKISRDANIYLDDKSRANIVESICKKVKKRKIGALSRSMYDQAISNDFLAFICGAFGITSESLVLGGRYNNSQDLMKLSNPAGKYLEQQPPVPMRVSPLNEMGSVSRAVKKRDILLHFPYESFNYLIRFLMEAVFDPKVDEAKITQYRVVENSAVIDIPVSAAQNGKEVTAFMELKVRFNKENNMSTAECMEQTDTRIIYSTPGLKVHTKVTVILRKGTPEGLKWCNSAYLNIGSFNEKTVKIYSDMALLISNMEIITDVNKAPAVLGGHMRESTFRHLSVARFNMVSELAGKIRQEVKHMRGGRKGRIILRMGELRDQHMIEGLYHTGEVGVGIDLVVQGICYPVPNQPYSANVRVTRIVDMLLERSWAWYFLNDGQEDPFLTSADWMCRNLSRRIETAFPIPDPGLRREIIDILNIQLSNNVKACYLGGGLRNNFKCNDNPVEVRPQLTIYDYLRSKSIR